MVLSITIKIQFRYTDEEFQELLINTNNSIQQYSFIRTVKSFQVLLYITNISIKHKSFVYSQMVRVLVLTI